MELGIRDGANLMGASVGIVRRDPRLLWFPVVSAACLALTTGFWIVQGAFLYASSGSRLLFVPLVALALYSLAFVGIFFNVGLAAAAAGAIDGDEPSLNDALNAAWANLGGIAAWAAYSIVVGVAIGFVRSFKGLRWVGAAAQVAWSLATIFVIPLIAIEDLDASSARQRSFELAKENWRPESGGLAALRLALLVPGFALGGGARLLADGHLHSFAGRALFGAALFCAFCIWVAADVVRQVFAVSLYRSAAR